MRQFRLSARLCLSVFSLISIVPFALSQTKSADVPHVVRYSGTLTNVDGSPRTGAIGVTFAIYADDQTTVPMWQEVQSVVADQTGRYSVLLGAARGEGLPEALFAANQARWLGLRVENEREQPRVLLAAVPYALKAADAETLGGKPLSAFVLNETTSGNGAQAGTGASPTTLVGAVLAPHAINAASGSTQPHVAMWTDNSGTLGDSIIQDTGTQIGIGKLPAFATLDVAGGGAFTGQLRVMGASAPTSGSGLEAYYDSGAGHIFAYDRDLNVEHDLAFGTNNEVYIKNSTLGVAKIPSLATLDVAGSGSFVGPVTFNGTNGFVNAANGNLVFQVGGTSVFYADGSTGNAVVTAGHNLVVANGTVTAATFSGSGASLTNLPAANLAGTVADARLSSNVALTNAGNVFTAPQTITSSGTNLTLSGGSTAIVATGSLAGVSGNSSTGKGVAGQSTTGDGVFGTSNNVGVHGSAVSLSGKGVWGENGIGGYGVYGSATGGGWGVYGISDSSYGVYGTGATGVFGVGHTGVYGASNGGANAVAGYFEGNVTVTGTLSKSGGSFKIDHPLDPANQYLSHSFVESPDMMNVYNGNIVLDANGKAWVTLPAWFESLNRDFRYQLTAIGAPGPNLYVAQEVSGNKFQIAGGKAHSKVSWQVTGIRQDVWANDHRIPVEEQKPAAEVGLYLYPQGFGQPAAKALGKPPANVVERAMGQ